MELNKEEISKKMEHLLKGMETALEFSMRRLTAQEQLLFLSLSISYFSYCFSNMLKSDDEKILSALSEIVKEGIRRREV